MQKYSKATLKFFSDSGLTKDHANKMQIKDINIQEFKKLFPNMRFMAGCFGHEIPYFDLNGKTINYARYRLHDDGELFPKYLQVKGQKSRFYFPPFVDWKKIATDPTKTIYITEGERKAAKACVMGFSCIGLGGVWNWRRNDHEDNEGRSQPIKDFQLIEWKDRKVIIVFDSDSQFNSNIQDAIKALRDTLIALGADPYRMDLPHKAGNPKVGLDDFLKKPNGKKAFQKLPLKPLLLNKTMTGNELIAQKYAAEKWIIKGLIPHGLTVMAGPPKIGKSLLILEFILALSAGRKALGHYETDKIKCLYLALEDSPRRLKERIQMLVSSGHVVNELSSFAYEWERVDDGGLLALQRRLEEDPNIKAVFIDTFAKMRRAPKGRENLYHQDYDAVGVLKKIADEFSIGIIVVHHTKKGASDDFLESVSGSMGITGAADTVMVLRRDRNDDEGVLHITGRDVGEQAIALAFDRGTWKYKGEANTVRATETQNEILEMMKSENKPLRQREIAELTGRKNGGLTKTLVRMVKDGHIVRNGYSYTLPERKAQKFEKKKNQKPD